MKPTFKLYFNDDNQWVIKIVNNELLSFDSKTQAQYIAEELESFLAELREQLIKP